MKLTWRKLNFRGLTIVCRKVFLSVCLCACIHLSPWNTSSVSPPAVYLLGAAESSSDSQKPKKDEKPWVLFTASFILFLFYFFQFKVQQTVNFCIHSHRWGVFSPPSPGPRLVFFFFFLFISSAASEMLSCNSAVKLSKQVTRCDSPEKKTALPLTHFINSFFCCHSSTDSSEDWIVRFFKL